MKTVQPCPPAPDAPWGLHPEEGGSLCAHRLSTHVVKPGLGLPNGRKGPWPPTLLPLSAEPLCRPSVATPGQGPGGCVPFLDRLEPWCRARGPALLSPPCAPVCPEPVLLLGKEPACPSPKLCSGLGVGTRGTRVGCRLGCRPTGAALPAPPDAASQVVVRLGCCLFPAQGSPRPTFHGGPRPLCWLGEA